MNKKNKNELKVVGVKAAEREALAFIETRGKTAIIGALDIMPKTSEMYFRKRVNIGSGLVSIVYEGEIAAARSAVDAAKNISDKLGGLFTSNVIPSPHSRIYEIIIQPSGKVSDIDAATGRKLALGIIEVEGFTAMIEAADAGIKAADVIIPGWVTVGSGLTTVFFRGEVAAVHSAVEEGIVKSQKISKIIAAHVIPQPHTGTEEATPIGGVREKNIKKIEPDTALGILETRGITGLIEGIDAGLKAASITVQGWEKIGQGIASTLFRGTVADVQSAMDAAVKGAETVGEVKGSYVIARPHIELDKGK